MTQLLLLGVVVCASGVASAQNLTDALKHGEEVFAKTCATGYCHGSRGTAAGAPRLAGRGFDQAFIGNTVFRGIPGTAMPSFATALPPADLVAVVAYLATLNGVPNPNISVQGDPAPGQRQRARLTEEAARGAQLFSDAVRGFGRCSTCHEVAGLGIPVTTAITNIPASAAALKTLATPNVKTATADGESMPALILSEGKGKTVFYDLTSAPPVQRTAEPGTVRFTDGSRWDHASDIRAYDDSELTAILAYLRAVSK
jgi:mono/diheme cytochrome c family protein